MLIKTNELKTIMNIDCFLSFLSWMLRIKVEKNAAKLRGQRCWWKGRMRVESRGYNEMLLKLLGREVMID